MNIGEIAERFIEACRIDLNSGGYPGPKPVKSLALPYTHDQADKNGWGTERLAEDRKQFWERLNSQPTAADISEADRTMSWLSCVPDESQRACLLAWASAHVGGESFNQWCFRQGFHPMTGTRRKDRALEHICRSLGGCMFQHNENGSEGVLIHPPEIGHVADSLAVPRSEANGIVSWAANDAFLPFQSEARHDFSWAAKRNERRRQREAAARKEQAKRRAA